MNGSKEVATFDVSSRRARTPIKDL